MAFTEASGPGTNLVQNPSWLGFTSPNYKQNNTKKKLLRSQPETAKIALSSLSVFILLKQMIFMKTSAPIAQRSPRSGSPGGSIVDGKAGPHLGAVPMIVVINGCYPLIILGGAPKIGKLVYNSNNYGLQVIYHDISIVHGLIINLELGGTTL
jgi:hypothetical protein